MTYKNEERRMNLNIIIINCNECNTEKLRKTLSSYEFHVNELNSYAELKSNQKLNSIIICPISFFEQNIKSKTNKVIFQNIPHLLIIEDYKDGIADPSFNIDCIHESFSENELLFRVNNLIHFLNAKNDLHEQHEKLRKYFDKSRKKTIELFGKHVDLKKAQKEIEYQNVRLEQFIEKKKYKTIELFGKHIDLKKAQKEIEAQRDKLEFILEKKKRKTIELFGKHIDLKYAKKEIDRKNEILKSVLEKNKQKTLDLFAKHIDLKKAKKKIQIQKNQIEKQNHSITDSIKYASFIQYAVLPKEERIHEILPRHMIIYKPRDIVSGDFYWMEKIDDNLFVVAADCTGHGVPGAFMSMLGISLLNELVNRYKNKKVNQILDMLRDKVIFSLHQTGRMDEAADGMDLSFCIINTKTGTMQFSGAHNPLYIIRNGKLLETKGDRMPIGFSLRISKPFSYNEINLEKGDRIFLFSDGYADQFGGENGMKMRYKVFQQHLLDSHTMPFEEQKKYLLDKFDEWKGDYTQIDDILVIGFEPI